MSGVVVLENTAGADWVWRLHVMAERSEALEGHKTNVPSHAEIRCYQDELRIHHFVATWPLRQVVRLRHPYFTGTATWMVAVWWIGKDKVSQAINDAGLAFALACEIDPLVALIHRVPMQAEEFVEVHGITLVQADWVPEDFLVVTGRGMWAGLLASHKS